MKTTQRLLVLALFIAVFSPFTASAQTWVTPNGTVIDDVGHILSKPVIPKLVFTGDPKKLCRPPLYGYQYGKSTGDLCKLYATPTR